MKLSFHGAARVVTGSKHLLHLKDGMKLLLDCGLFQGMGKETVELNSEWGFDPAEISYVIISHAHIDHIGLLPKLVKDGFSGPIYCTDATAPLIHVLLEDSARIQEADVDYGNKRRRREKRPEVAPLYTEEDAQSVFPLLRSVPYNQKETISPDLELLYTDCGHILGSAAVHLTIREKGKTVQITFSGDIGRYRDIILRSPQPFPQADFIIMESTYGDSLHDLTLTASDKLLHQIEQTCLHNRGKLVIPAFSLGRTQEILYLLNRLDLERRLPKVRYYVDSPLSIKTTEIIRQHAECFNKDVIRLLQKDDDVFSFEGLHFISDVEDSIALNNSDDPCVIVSSSGMAEAGRVKHHIRHTISDPRNTILFSGYCEPHSLGGRLRDGDQQVRLFGQLYNVRAKIDAIDTLSAHGDYEDLSQWLACQDPHKVRQLFLVHGEYEVQVNFRERLLRKGFTDIAIPSMHQEIGLGV